MGISLRRRRSASRYCITVEVLPVCGVRSWDRTGIAKVVTGDEATEEHGQVAQDIGRKAAGGFLESYPV